MTDDPTVHRLEIPTPYAIGPVNAYLIEDDPLTLIDCGPAWTTALDGLEDQLQALGHRIADIQLLLVTHEHSDHLGLANALLRRSGAELACHEDLAAVAGGIVEWFDEEHETAAAIMVRHGVEDDVVTALHAATRVHRHWTAPVSVDRPLAAGSTVELRDRRLRVVHAPGHSPTDTLFVDDDRRIAFVGDHLLAHVSPNALVASRPPRAPRADRYPALAAFRASLQATHALDVDRSLTGHGEDVNDHRALIDRRLAGIESRAERILEALGQGPISAHRIAAMIWGPRAISQTYLTLSEVLGHLDLLIERGVVVELDDDGRSLFAEA